MWVIRFIVGSVLVVLCGLTVIAFFCAAAEDEDDIDIERERRRALEKRLRMDN